MLHRFMPITTNLRLPANVRAIETDGFRGWNDWGKEDDAY